MEDNMPPESDQLRDYRTYTPYSARNRYAEDEERPHHHHHHHHHHRSLEEIIREERKERRERMKRELKNILWVVLSVLGLPIVMAALLAPQFFQML